MTQEAIKRAEKMGYILSWFALLGSNEAVSVYQAQTLLDPQFWVKLGEHEMWYGQNKIPCISEDVDFSKVVCDDQCHSKRCQLYGLKTWKQQMHSFIDHIINGGDYDSFFKKILK